MTSNNTNSAESRRRHRKIAAILAGGLVLGVGTMTTLASWNDSEYVTANFSSGVFKLQGSTDGESFSDHASAASPASLTFTAPFDILAPGDTVYAPYAVRLTADTTNAATVTITNPVTTGDVSHLTYTLLQTESFGCAADTTGTELVSDASVGTADGAQTFDLTKGHDGEAGEAANLCIKVTAGADLVQDQGGSSTWRFQAVSH